MRQRLVLVAILALLLASVAAWTQQNTNLVVRVEPEARLEPEQVALRFIVSADGKSDITSQSATIGAWVRSLPGRRIGLTMRLDRLDGPEGVLADRPLRWTGSVLNASAGARQAKCSDGSFASASVQDLVQGWDTSGILSCGATFELAGARSLAPGVYSGLVRFTITGQ